MPALSRLSILLLLAVIHHRYALCSVGIKKGARLHL
nr:MAG TPA: hypothetical protein [Caudoviricetes sp.]